MSKYIYSYKPGSNSAAALSKILGYKRIKHEGSKFKGGKEHTVINWGASTLPYGWAETSRIINKPEDVALCTNKLEFFRNMQRIAGGDRAIVPDFTTDIEQAKKWAATYRHPILCRTVLNGHSGEGIVLANTPEEIVEAPLYVKYIPKRAEFRMHFAFRNHISQQQKARSGEVPDEQVDWKVRNRKNGFIYKRNDIVIPDVVHDVVYTLMAGINLDFGAVDIVYNDYYDRAYVLEINTAPGLEGSTLDHYVNAFQRNL